MGDDKGKSQVGPNYLQGDRSRVYQLEDRLGLHFLPRLQTKFSEWNIGVLLVD